MRILFQADKLNTKLISKSEIIYIIDKPSRIKTSERNSWKRSQQQLSEAMNYSPARQWNSLNQKAFKNKFEHLITQAAIRLIQPIS